jgi:hypothetical protein
MSLPADPTATAEAVALYAAGALPPADARAFEDRLAAGWPAAAAELARTDPAVMALAAGVPAVEPPPRVRAELLARLADVPPDEPSPADQARAADALPGLLFRFADDEPFAATPYPGVAVRVLHLDRPGRRFTALLRLAPGARYPGHHHDGPEECLVLAGSLIVGGVRMRPGDYQRAAADSDHAEQWTDTGATLYLTAPVSLLG